MKYLVIQKGNLSHMYGPAQEAKLNIWLDRRGFEDVLGQKGKSSSTYPGWIASITDTEPVSPMQAIPFEEISIPA